MNGIYTVKFGSRTIHLKYTFRGVKQLQKLLGCKISELETRLENPSAEDIEALILCGLIYKNKDITTDEVEELIDEAGENGKFTDLLEAASNALGYFFAGEDGLKKAVANKVKSGTGRK